MARKSKCIKKERSENKMSTVSYLYVEMVLVFGACLGKSDYIREG